VSGASTLTRLRKCRHCRHFRNDSEFLEASFPGLTSMSSGYGSVRAEDGICIRHDRYLSAESSCPDFSAIADYAEVGILRPVEAQANPSPPRAPARQESSYFSGLIARAENKLLSDVPEDVGVPSMTDLPHEPHGLAPPELTSWLAAFATALLALLAIGVLPHVWG
jgi:hypothetical protein